MKNDFKKIEESLDAINPKKIDIIEDRETNKIIFNNDISDKNDLDQDLDYKFTRGNLYNLIQKGQEAIDGIMEVAQQSDSPRAYEVAGQLIKSVAETTDKLIDLQQKMKKLKDEDFSTPKNITNNALFVGSTADLQKILKQGFKESK